MSEPDWDGAPEGQESAISFTAPLWRWAGGAGSWYFITVPDEQSLRIRAESFAQRGGFGSVKVEVAVGDTRWRTSVFLQKSGGYLLPAKAQVRRDAGVIEGGEVSVVLSLL